MNKITVSGRLSSDVEIRDVNGRNVANFNVASQNRHKNQEGKYDTNFYRVQIWGASADSAAKFLKKGHRVIVNGDFVARDYVGNDGVKRTSLEIYNGEFDLIETRAEAEAKSTAQAQAAPAPQNFTPVENPDDLPF